MSHGWIKLHRSLKKHWVCQDAEILRVWITLLLEASHKNRSVLFNGELVELERGSLVLSKLELSGRLGLSRPRLDRVLKKLERDRMILQETSSRCTVVSVVNYHRHQMDETDDRTAVVTAAVQPKSSCAATAKQPACTNKKVKIDKTDQEGREPHPLEDHFLPREADAEWVQNRQYTHAGRRPLRRYPQIFLAPEELAEVFEQLGLAGVPPEQYKLVFKRVAARLTTAQAQGKDPQLISAYNWLTGWAKEEVVRELTASNNLERSRVCLVGARR